MRCRRGFVFFFFFLFSYSYPPHISSCYCCCPAAFSRHSANLTERNILHIYTIYTYIGWMHGYIIMLLSVLYM